jgi:hypothetical protein
VKKGVFLRRLRRSFPHFDGKTEKALLMISLRGATKTWTSGYLLKELLDGRVARAGQTGEAAGILRESHLISKTDWSFGEPEALRMEAAIDGWSLCLFALKSWCEAAEGLQCPRLVEFGTLSANQRTPEHERASDLFVHTRM